MSNSYRDLVAWQQAVELVTFVYDLTGRYPNSERYGLSSQTQRAAVSIAANIAEGQGRNSPREFAFFLGISRGSLHELETHFFVAANVHYITLQQRDEALRRSDRVLRLINGLMNSLVEQNEHDSERETGNEKRETLARR